MLKQPITFILEAGASKAYGYPLGPTLLSMIKEYSTPPEPNSTSGYWTNLLRCGLKPANLVEFNRRIRKSPLYSIDTFLEVHTSISSLGRC